MLVAGLTGGTASGKSAVAKILSECGAEIIDADTVCRRLVEPGKPAWREIVSVFGKNVLESGGSIDRKKLGGIIFHDPEKREALNSILHPKVIDEEWRIIARMEQDKPEALVIVNAALLIESGNYRDVDTVIMVVAEEETMIRRMVNRDGLSREEALMRLKAQMPTKEKIKFADHIVRNDGTPDELRAKVLDLYMVLKEIGNYENYRENNN